MTLPNPVNIPFPIEFITVPDSNYRKGRLGNLPDVIVLHIAEGSKASVVATFKDPSVQKSSHFLVNRDGSITQFVNTSDAAYCNGIIDNPVSELVLQRFNTATPATNPNNWTISIEHEGFATQEINVLQYAATAKLVKLMHDKWNVPLDRTHIIGHREIFSQKTCPGLLNVEKVIQLARKL